MIPRRSAIRARPSFFWPTTNARSGSCPRSPRTRALTKVQLLARLGRPEGTAGGRSLGADLRPATGRGEGPIYGAVV
jgi:hypothetical protein